MMQSTAQVMPETQVEALMQAVADENGLEFESNLTQIPNNQLNKQTVASKASSEEKKTELIGTSGTTVKNNPDSSNNNQISSTSAAHSSAKIDSEESLEERLRRLQGM